MLTAWPHCTPNTLRISVAYSGTSLPENPTLADLKSVTADYEAICVTVMQAIADRYDPA